MRLFFSLQPDAKTCLDIVSFRESALPPLDHPVRIGNLHITLAFLGDVDPRRMEALDELAGSVTTAPFELMLNELGYWPKPSILWIGASRTPEALNDLVLQLRSVARSLRLPAEKRRFLPHVTIARNCTSPPPAGVMSPAITTGFSSFTLIESTLRKDGAHYRTLADWPLSS